MNPPMSSSSDPPLEPDRDLALCGSGRSSSLPLRAPPPSLPSSSDDAIWILFLFFSIFTPRFSSMRSMSSSSRSSSSDLLLRPPDPDPDLDRDPDDPDPDLEPEEPDRLRLLFFFLLFLLLSSSDPESSPM